MMNDLGRLWRLMLIVLGVCTGCSFTSVLPTTDISPTPQLVASAAERREVAFAAADGMMLAGELTLPDRTHPVPLVMIMHHSGPVDRDAYSYMLEPLVAAGFAVFRFDKRGTGASSGAYGCCEAADALAAYRAAVAQPNIDRDAVFIVAQSIGTMHLAAQFAAFVAAQPPRGVVLLSNLLGPEEVTAIDAPVLIVVADSEPELATIGPAAAVAHERALLGGTELYIAANAEHSLFDISSGPIDWSNPDWVQRYHRGALDTLIAWLAAATGSVPAS